MTIFKKKCLNSKAFFLLAFIVGACSLLQATPANAMVWNAGKIIDDVVFTNANAMDISSIQNFLNSKVPSCSYNCLKNYSENGKSAAHIIYDTAQQFQINPQTLIVLLQKEQGLVTDTSVSDTQYRTATGYGCPDTSVCESQYFGFTNQLYHAARMFRAIMNNSPNWYTPYVLGNNTIKYNPQSSCGSSNVYIENRATQALYNYTPYQPNQAALDAGYGSAPPCGSYGNRNFKLYFEDWFGPTTNPNLYYAVIKSSSSPALYLQTSAGKYYIPSGEILQAWGLETLAVKEVPQSYIDSLKNHDWLDRLLKDDWGNLFFVDNKRLHYIRSSDHLALWNLNPNVAAQSLGLTYTMPGGEWVGRFVRDLAQPNGPTWLVDKGKKRLIPNGDILYQWGYTSNQQTTVTTAYLNSMPTATDAGRYASDGTKYLIDMGRKLALPNTNIENALYGGQTPQVYEPITLKHIRTESAWQFVVNTINGRWYMLEGGKKHYIPSGRLSEIWGRTKDRALTTVSDGYLASLPDGGNLSYLIQTTNPTAYWLMDGKKHAVTGSQMLHAWAGTSTPPIYSSQSIAHLFEGAPAGSIVNGIGSPFTYVMDGGIKRYLTTSNARNAWGGTTMGVANELVSSIPEGSFVNYLIKNPSGQAYLLMNGQIYPIDPAFYDVWGVANSTPTISSETIARYPVAATLKAFIRIGATSYIMTGNGQKTPLQRFADAYQASSLGEVTLPNDYFNSTADASYLVRSKDVNDTRMWLITGGKKLLSTFEQQVSYGYLSQGIQPTQLSPATLALIPDDSRTPSLLIQKQNSGIKFLSFGYALGFPDGDTLMNYISTTHPILQISPSIFDAIGARRSVSRIIKDDQGRYYLVENGMKRYIPNQTAYGPYSSVPVTYLEGTTMYLIPTGSPLN